MIINELKQFVNDNPTLVKMRLCENYPELCVLKYSKSVFFNNLWNNFLEECRGTIVDEDFNLISYPFTKIYNYGIEDKSPVFDLSTNVNAYRKINGFMVAVTMYCGDILVSTTGSTDSDYVKMARELIEPNIDKYRKTCKEHPEYTFMFECVHRNDPHIIPEQEGMYLLGCRKKVIGSKILHDPYILMGLARMLNCFWPESVTTNMARLSAMAKECKHEGYVAYTDNGVSFKIKSPYYLTNKWLARNPKTDKLMSDNFKKQIDEEYYPLLSYIRENIVEYTALTEQERLDWIRVFYEK